MNHEELGTNAKLAQDALEMKPTRGIPSWIFHTLDIPFMEQATGNPTGSYREEPDRVYIEFQKKVGTCLVDQYLADNPLTMGEAGYESDTERTATTGAEEVVLDGIRIDSPESVIGHLERFVFSSLEKRSSRPIRTTERSSPESSCASVRCRLFWGRIS